MGNEVPGSLPEAEAGAIDLDLVFELIRMHSTAKVEKNTAGGCRLFLTPVSGLISYR